MNTFSLTRSRPGASSWADSMARRRVEVKMVLARRAALTR